RGNHRDGLHGLHHRRQGASARPLQRAGDAGHHLGRKDHGRDDRMTTLPSREITAEEIEYLAVGAWVLGTGGGGSPYMALLNLRRLYAEGKRVRLMSPLDLPDEAHVAVCSNMGAPLVGQERLVDSRTAAKAVELQ